MDTHFALDRPLEAVGALLARRRQNAAIVVVGGTALNLLGVLSRSTADVDVIAVAAVPPAGPPTTIANPTPLPPHLSEVVTTVARDFDIPTNWLNTVVGAQWDTGLPPEFDTRVSWRQTGGLWIGLPDRVDLIFLKLYAATDAGSPASRHFTDLMALQPAREELEEAARWIHTQDPSPAMDEMVTQVVTYAVERIA